MSNVQIKVNTQNNGWQSLDMDPAQSFALSFEANDIGELKSRRAGSSSTVKLPRTPHNNVCLGYCDINDASAAPYTRIKCQVLVDGTPVVDPDSVLEISSVDDKSFSGNIFFGLFDLFAALSEKKLRDLPANTFTDPVFSALGVSDSFATTSPMALIDWNAEDIPYNQIDNGNGADELPRVNGLSLRPVARLKTLIDAICAQQGYSLETTVDTDDLYLNMGIPCTGNDPITRDQAGLKGYYHQYAPVVPLNQFYDFTQGECFPSDVFSVNPANTGELWYKPQFRGTYNFLLTGTVTGQMRVTGYYNNARVMYDKGRNYYYATISIKVDDPDKNIIFNAKQLLPQTTLRNFRVEMQSFTSNSSVVYNDVYPVVSNLPDISQEQLLKMFVQLFGLTITVDNRRKKLYCYNFGKVYENRKYARDWSNKLDQRTGDIKFHLSEYGQVNIIKYNENEETAYDISDNEREVKFPDEGRFELADQTLAPEKNLFEFEPVACDSVLHFNLGQVAKIRHLRNGTSDDDAPLKLVYLNEIEETPAENGIPVPLLTITNSAFNETEPATPKTVNSAIIADPNPIRAQVLVEQYYKPLYEGMLNKLRVVSCKFKLTPVDVANFDHSVPVYLGKYGSYFYVNKIDKYIPGKLTSVELIKL